MDLIVYDTEKLKNCIKSRIFIQSTFYLEIGQFYRFCFQSCGKVATRPQTQSNYSSKYDRDISKHSTSSIMYYVFEYSSLLVLQELATEVLSRGGGLPLRAADLAN
jgi:hypothetical protein